MVKLLIVLGTRPEYIKLKNLIYELKKDIICDVLLVRQHTTLVDGVNYDHVINIDKLTEDRIGNIITNILIKGEKIIKEYDYVIVQGDTTTGFAASLLAFNLGKKIIHIEAGLRSFDIQNPYPEEFNRRAISLVSDVNFLPTEFNLENVKKENINGINFVVGNTSTDNLLKYDRNCDYDKKVLVTLHRRENINKLKKWFKAINNIAEKNKDYDFIFPAHPNPDVRKNIKVLSSPNIKIIEPIPHNELIELLRKVSLVITDSGGLQEESSYFNKKCLICRETTERQEVLDTNGVLVNYRNIEEVFEKEIKTPKIDYICPYVSNKNETYLEIKKVLMKLIG